MKEINRDQFSKILKENLIFVRQPRKFEQMYREYTKPENADKPLEAICFSVGLIPIRNKAKYDHLVLCKLIGDRIIDRFGSVQNFAEMLGFSPSTIYRIVNGESMGTLPTWLAVIDMLEINITGE